MKKVISNKNNVSHGELLSTTQSIYNLWSRSAILLNEQVHGVSKLLIEGVTIVQTHIHIIRAELLTRSHIPSYKTFIPTWFSLLWLNLTLTLVWLTVSHMDIVLVHQWIYFTRGYIFLSYEQTHMENWICFGKSKSNLMCEPVFVRFPLKKPKLCVLILCAHIIYTVLIWYNNDFFNEISLGKCHCGFVVL